MSGPLSFDDEPETSGQPEAPPERKPETPPPAKPPGISRYGWWLGVLVVLPAVLMLAEEVDVAELPREALRRLKRVVPGRRRRATAA